jgi:hypothetical protein
MALIKEYFELTKNYQENYGEKTSGDGVTYLPTRTQGR